MGRGVEPPVDGEDVGGAFGRDREEHARLGAERADRVGRRVGRHRDDLDPERREHP